MSFCMSKILWSSCGTQLKSPHKFSVITLFITLATSHMTGLSHYLFAQWIYSAIVKRMWSSHRTQLNSPHPCHVINTATGNLNLLLAVFVFHTFSARLLANCVLWFPSDNSVQPQGFCIRHRIILLWRVVYSGSGLYYGVLSCNVFRGFSGVHKNLFCTVAIRFVVILFSQYSTASGVAHTQVLLETVRDVVASLCVLCYW